MKIEFKWDIDVKISEKIINNIEKNYNIKLPIDYVKAVTLHDGAKIKVVNSLGEWKEGIVNIPNWHGKYAGVALLSYDNETDINNTKVVITYDVFKDSLPDPKKMFPFAIDGGGNIFFFDYRKDINEPSIVFLDHESAITEEDLTEEELAQKPLNDWLDDNLYHVCDSFEELLNLIYPFE